MPDCVQVPCDPVDLNAQDIELAQELGLPTGFLGGTSTVMFNVLSGLLYFIIAAIIFWRTPSSWMGLVVSFSLAFLGGSFFTSSDDALLRAFPEAGILLSVVLLPGFAATFSLFYVFPDGRFVPEKMRWIGIALIATSLVTQHRPNLGGLWPTLYGWQIGALFLTGAFAQVYRFFRVSSATERQQTKWVVLGLLGMLALVIAWLTLAISFPPDRPSESRIYALLAAVPLITLFAITLPLSFAFSILRYRLWDIDILINRTLVYGALTGALALIYYGGVVLLQGLFRALTGQGSQLAVVVSTLAIAALFTPLRRRVQNFIDRRFYRRRYNAAQALARFAV
ncbi:MAG: hypothetical protein ACE5FI_02675, partial [Anaerolineales bacterium]